MAVYFIQAGEDGPVKIGYAESPAERMRSLQAGNAAQLKIIRQIDGAISTERIVHERYQDLHIRGEWFHFSRDMLTAQFPASLHEVAPISPLARAVAICGGQVALASMVGCTQQAISWALKNNNGRVRLPMAVKIEQATGGRVKREELCPCSFEEAA